MTGNSASSRRAMILFAVLVIVPIVALIATTAMYAANAELTSSEVSLRETRARALAWSGVQAVMAELADQRQTVLEGRAPKVTETWELFKDASGARGVVRLLAVDDGESKLKSENAKINLNTASREMLAKVPGLSDELAKAIVAARSRRFTSVPDLARVEGITPAMLGEDGGTTEPGAADHSAGALDRVLTALSFEPSIQFGVGERGSDQRGMRRLNVNMGYSEALATGLAGRLGSELSDGIKSLLKSAGKLKTTGDLVAAIEHAGIATKDWAPLLDALAVSDDPYIVGRVDMNTAPASVLAAVPGISPGEADQIVQARSRLDASAMTSPAWPVAEGILSVDHFAQASTYLTTRSFQWRVIVEAGLTREEANEQRATTGDAALASRIVLEAVIDIASEQPRVAYLRDITLLAAQRGMYAAVRETDEGSPQSARTADVAVSGGPGTDQSVASNNPSVQPADSPVSDPSATPSPPAQSRIADVRSGRWTTGKSAQGEQP